MPSVSSVISVVKWFLQLLFAYAGTDPAGGYDRSLQRPTRCRPTGGFGKAFAREAKRLSKIASSLGLKAPEDYASISSDEAAAMAEDFDLDEEVQAPPEQWFDADEGLAWISQLRAHIESDRKSVKDPDSVLADLAEYERVLTQAKPIGAKWHFSVDF